LETIAVYREERVKVYGISEKHDLCLGTLQFPTNRVEEFATWIMDLEKSLEKFELVTSYSARQDRTVLHFLFEQNKKNRLVSEVNTRLESDSDIHFNMQSTVDLLYLHGPHFQDRDGIAEIAFTALKKHKIQVLVVGCAGTSMYIVTPENLGPTATRILTETFLIPTTKT